MSRDRKQNEKAVLNTLAFLRELNERCEQGNLRTLTWLSDKYELSHNSGTACKELNIIVKEDGVFKWGVKGAPGRYMALEVMDNCLDRSKGKGSHPVLPDFGAFADKIVQKLDSIAVQNESSLRSVKGRMLGRALPQSSMESNTLFSASESKEATRKDFLKSVISALYSGKSANEITDDFINATDTAAFRVTDDVINRLYAVK